MPRQPADRQDDSTPATDEPAVMAAIRRSADPWISAEAVASASGLPLERVAAVLESAPAFIVEVTPGQPRRYSTREHYRATTGLIKRYIDAVLAS